MDYYFSFFNLKFSKCVDLCSVFHIEINVHNRTKDSDVRCEQEAENLLKVQYVNEYCGNNFLNLQTLPTNWLIVFDYFVGLALKGLITFLMEVKPYCRSQWGIRHGT